MTKLATSPATVKPAGNLNRRFQGTHRRRGDREQEKQLELLALRMRNVKIDYLYSAPKRAYAAAEAINQFHHFARDLWRRI